MEARTPSGEIGVIIGRFQVPDLHVGHRDLIDTVRKKHKKVLMFICSTKGVRNTRKNPMDYFTRMKMMQEHYPDMAFMSLWDIPGDDNAWSKTVDVKIGEAFGDHATAVLYGSRDAFIPHYLGKFPVVELAESFDISGTAARAAVSDEVRQHSEWRKGIVYAAHDRHPMVFPTVDIAVIKAVGPVHQSLLNKTRQIALGRKNTDPPGKWRFPGGFLDPQKDNTFEAAAKRELSEEFGISLNVDSKFTYLGSHNVNDSRYRGEMDEIITTLFVTRHLWGPLTAGDDIDEVKWFDLDGFNLETMVQGHGPLMQMVLEHSQCMK